MRILNAIAPLIFAGFGLAACAGSAAAADAKAPAMAAKAPAGPAVKLIEQQLKLAADGSAMLAAHVQISAAAAGKIDLPSSAWGEVQDFTVVEAPADAKLDLAAKGPNPHLSVTLPAAAESVSLRYSANIPAPKPPATDAKGGDAAKAAEPATRFKAFAHRFMNGTNLPVERYRLEVMFPQGYVVHNVPEALPKAKGRETVSRVRLIEKDGLQGAALEIAGLKLGDVTSMRIEYEPAQKSLAVFWFGLLLSVLYLVFFRDVLRPKTAADAEDHHAQDSHKQHE